MFDKFLYAMSDLPYSIQILILVLLMVAAVILIFLIGRKIGKNAGLRESEVLLQSTRKDAVKRSRAVLGGQMAEQVAPFLPGFPCNPADVRFVGKPIDFIGFPGAAEGQPIREILLIEIKTGSSALSRREREIQQAVEAGHISYVVYRNGDLSGNYPAN